MVESLDLKEDLQDFIEDEGSGNKPNESMSYNYPVWVLEQSQNAFKVTPVTPFSIQMSLVVDRKTQRVQEAEL
jgi:hypothetical protein